MLYVAIVEDNIKAGKLIKEYLECEDIMVTAIYISGGEALKTIPTLPFPDLVLMDIGLPDISGIEVTRRLKENYPSLEIIIQTIFEDAKTVIEAIKAGASGYILKGSSREEIIKALWSVKSGGSFLTPKIAKKVLQEFQIPKREEKTSFEKYKLTDREEEILNNLIKGTSYKEIAFNMSISIHTVNNHTRHIYEKLRVNSRGEAVAKATKQI